MVQIKMRSLRKKRIRMLYLNNNSKYNLEFQLVSEENKTVMAHLIYKECNSSLLTHETL